MRHTENPPSPIITSYRGSSATSRTQILQGDLSQAEVVLEELDSHRTRRILNEITTYHRHRFARFDEGFISRLLTHPDVPALLRTNPLTQREWQVLGLTYSGYSNDQIAGEFDVATTPLKTHIRNLYQKLGVTHRAEAMHQPQSMLKMMGYV